MQAKKKGKPAVKKKIKKTSHKPKVSMAKKKKVNKPKVVKRTSVSKKTKKSKPAPRIVKPKKAKAVKVKRPAPFNLVKQGKILGKDLTFLANLGTMGIPPYQEKRGEEYMNEHQRQHFRQILNAWKHQL